MKISFRNALVCSLIFITSMFYGVCASSNCKIEKGFYNIVSVLDEKMSLDVDSAAEFAGANIQIWDNNLTPAQIFEVKECGGKYYQITALCSGKRLDVQYGAKQNGTNVWQHNPNDTDSQKWEIKPDDTNKDYFYISSKINGYNLDVAGGQKSRGTNVQIWQPNGTDAQKWKFKKVDPEKSAQINDGRNYAIRLNWVKDRAYEHYVNKISESTLILCDDEFKNNFSKIFENKKNSKVDFCSSANKIKNINKYRRVINAKYSPCYLKLLFPQKQIEHFKETYAVLLYQTTIDYLKKNNIPIYFFNAPNAHKIKNLNQFEKDICLIKCPGEFFFVNDKNLAKRIYTSNQKCIDYALSSEYPNHNKIIKIKNHLGNADFNGKYIKISGGKRLTLNAPQNCTHHIHMYGPCTVKGKYVPDEYTIANFIQKRINADFPNSYSVENYGAEADQINDFESILDTEFKPGDIVIEERNFTPALINTIKKNNCPFKELSPLFNRPHNIGHWFINCPTHMNQNGNKVVGDYMYSCIKDSISKRKSLKDNSSSKITFHNIKDNAATDDFVKNNPDFLKFIDELKVLSKDKKGKKIGSLNVNCNPFTLGHRYLIEQSLKKVDHLYLFVVEEDASEFPFKDRYEMVKRGVADLPNITVLKTGKWMCSKLTFPDYFNKDDLQDKIILNPTKDIDLYGKYIAPALGATIRFAGEEPLDLITRQHNNFMKNKLPEYGIEFCEIPRKLLPDGRVISASNVRKCLKAKNFDEMKKFLPLTTYNYLIEHFS